MRVSVVRLCFQFCSASQGNGMFLGYVANTGTRTL